MARPRKPREADPWRQRDRFIALADADVAELISKGMSEDDAYQTVAIAIGLKTGASLKTAYRHDHRRKPKRPTVELAAQRWGVLESEIYGTESHRELSPAKRLVRQSVTKVLTDVNTSDEDAERIWNAIEGLMEAGKIPKPR